MNAITAIGRQVHANINRQDYENILRLANQNILDFEDRRRIAGAVTVFDITFPEKYGSPPVKEKSEEHTRTTLPVRTTARGTR